MIGSPAVRGATVSLGSERGTLCAAAVPDSAVSAATAARDTRTGDVRRAIVLVDCANQYRERGMDAAEAVATAGRVRLRPILLTTGTTVLGLMPMALGLGEGAEVRTPLALTVMFGLATSTLLTLIVIPVLYTLVLDFRQRWFRSPNFSDVAVRP